MMATRSATPITKIFVSALVDQDGKDNAGGDCEHWQGD
jgi:hypothetical protein